MPSPLSNHLRAAFYALAGFTCWVGGDTFMKLAGEIAMPKYEIMIIGSFGGLAALFTITAARGEIKKLKPQKYGALFFLALLFALTYACWLTALARIPLADFYTIIFLSPLIVSLLATLLLREALDRRKIAATLVGFIGILVAVNPFHASHEKTSLIGLGATFAGMLVLVAQQLTLRFLADHESRESSAFYPRLGGVVCGLIALIIYGSEPIPLRGLLFSIATGAIGGLGWMFMAQAYKLAPAAAITPFHYSQIVTGALFGFLIWHNVPSLRLLLGAAVIIASGIYIMTLTRKGELAEAPIDNP